MGFGVCLFGVLAITTAADSGTGGPQGISNTDISVSWSPSVLWPPDHKLSPITITGHDLAGDAGDLTATYSITVTKITANEDGCGDTGGPDWTGVGNTSGPTSTTKNAVVHIQLRAERCGQATNGRIYTVTVSAVDDELSGTVRRTGSTTITVTVPHDQGAS
jgi:hypothetical protein